MQTGLFLLIQSVAIAFLALMLLLALFEPGLPYQVTADSGEPLDSKAFQRILSALGAAQMYGNVSVEVLSNGEVFYERELEAMAAAGRTIHLEAYIFHKGEVTRRILNVLVERARAGVRVRLVIDAVGSFFTRNKMFTELRAAGGQVNWYHAIRCDNLPRFNNRTHRELIIVDGRVGFLGGAGFADHWLKAHGPRHKKRRWRDTMFRIEGEIVRDLQSTFAENWLETSGEVISDPDCFPDCRTNGSTLAMVVASSPTRGRSTRNRMLFQTLIASARNSIRITTPYFLPDRSARAEIARAIRERGVQIQVITPGKHSDHLLTRRSSRRLYGDLLRAGVEIYEYRPSMIHAKVMIIDGQWSVVGSSNFDHRSFGINDEVNLAAFDEGLAKRIAQDFERDLKESRRVNYRNWSRRPLFERAHEWIGRLLERQQ